MAPPGARLTRLHALFPIELLQCIKYPLNSSMRPICAAVYSISYKWLQSTHILSSFSIQYSYCIKPAPLQNQGSESTRNEHSCGQVRSVPNGMALLVKRLTTLDTQDFCNITHFEREYWIKTKWPGHLPVADLTATVTHHIHFRLPSIILLPF